MQPAEVLLLLSGKFELSLFDQREVERSRARNRHFNDRCDIYGYPVQGMRRTSANLTHLGRLESG